MAGGIIRHQFCISILLPFPLSIVVIIGIFILLNLYMRKKMTARMGIGGGVGGIWLDVFS